MPNNYLSVLYKHIIEVENKNEGLKVCVCGGGGGEGHKHTIASDIYIYLKSISHHPDAYINKHCYEWSSASIQFHQNRTGWKM